MSKIVLIENKSEIGAGTRGASLGIDAVKIAALNAQSNYFKEAKILKIENENDRLWEDIDFLSAKRIKGVVEVYKRISDTVSRVLGKGKFPILLSGDHSNAGGTIAGIKKAFPDKRLGVIWIDAHADLHSPYTSPSGNIHGMPLATALGVDNKKYAVKEISEEVKKHWDKLKSIGDIQPKINPEDLVLIAVRDTEDPEDYFIANNKVKTISVANVRRTGTQEISEQVLTYLKDCDILYISFDVDSMDCDLVSYGTGTPVPNGLTEQEASSLINHLLIDKRVKCFEVVEINPCLDNRQNKMAETAYRIMEGASAIIEKRG